MRGTESLLAEKESRLAPTDGRPRVPGMSGPKPMQ